MKNLKSFENFSKEEIYDHRKAKFLQIGRGQGFNKSANLEGGGLSYREANIQKFVSHIAKDPFAAALEMAQTIASKNPDAIRASKKLLSRAPYISEAEGLLMEAELQQAVIGTPNQIEAVMAEMEKRPAKFLDSKK